MSLLGPVKSGEQKTRARIQRYFEPDKGPSPWLFATGGVVALIVMVVLTAFQISFYATIAAAVLAVVLFAIAWVSFSERALRADDDDIDIWRDKVFDLAVERIRADAVLATSDLMNPKDPIVFAGLPRFANLEVRYNHDDGTLKKRWRVKAKVGEDGVTRFTPPCLTVLHFTKDHLLAYQCDISLFTGEVLNETLDEYFWQDIVSLQIERQTLPTEADDRALYDQWSEDFPDDETERYAPLHADEPVALATGKRTILRLKTTNGGGLEIILADERFATKKDCLQARNNAAIDRLRKLLRDRKARR